MGEGRMSKQGLRIRPALGVDEGTPIALASDLTCRVASEKWTNTGDEPRPEAGARRERRLLASAAHPSYVAPEQCQTSWLFFIIRRTIARLRI
mgnify:CR=1 FL=1